MSFDVNHFQNQTLSDVSRIEERLIAVACFFFFFCETSFSEKIFFQT